MIARNIQSGNPFVAMGCAALLCAGCSSDPEGFTKAMDVLGTATTIAVAVTQPPPPPPPPAEYYRRRVDTM